MDHFLGWPLELYSFKKDVYVKNQLFNNVWTNLTELIEEDSEDLQLAAIEQAAPNLYGILDFYGYITELVRTFGEPKVVADEYVGGVLCQKMEFSPNFDSAKTLLEFREINDDIDKESLVLWIGKEDKLMHKMDLRVNFMQENFKTQKKEPGFAYIMAEFSDINKSFKVSTPVGIN